MPGNNNKCLQIIINYYKLNGQYFKHECYLFEPLAVVLIFVHLICQVASREDQDRKHVAQELWSACPSFSDSTKTIQNDSKQLFSYRAETLHYVAGRQ